ncbi:hypothetical protein WOSG25_180310 [Weissella oryzae SG25]|uniref:Replication terminator protein n=1 Tax=Weissella oryzae (strain DSM 25784 / JCM 18191 / LMG 30913 / SG25) TaxID=1329250 RepID=A0A069CVR8_WEIOS|nr:hypothetical protein [Weissella oryzae]GAK31880.1 hypothetical protein WOSG25_180310 [Weissella oryzae SG25]
MANIDLNLNKLAKGALAEDVNIELEKIAKNLLDPNAKDNTFRELNIKVKFKPDEDGTIATLTAVSSKLAPRESKATRVLVGENGAGNVEMREMLSEVPGQTIIDPDSGQLLTDTGEPVAGEPSVRPVKNYMK